MKFGALLRGAAEEEPELQALFTCDALSGDPLTAPACCMATRSRSRPRQDAARLSSDGAAPAARSHTRLAAAPRDQAVPCVRSRCRCCFGMLVYANHTAISGSQRAGTAQHGL